MPVDIQQSPRQEPEVHRPHTIEGWGKGKQYFQDIPEQERRNVILTMET